MSCQVTLTWDETPVDRVNAFKGWDEDLGLEEFEARLKDYIAPPSDEEDEEDDNDADESECSRLIIAELLVGLPRNDDYDSFHFTFFCCCFHLFLDFIWQINLIALKFPVKKPKKRPFQDTIALYRNLLKDIDDKEKEEDDERQEKEETEKKFLEALGGSTVMLLLLVNGDIDDRCSQWWWIIVRY